MKCYIHIGHPKTATTTIQFFLDKNKDVLNKKNYFIDFFGPIYNHLNISFCCEERYRDVLAFKHIGINSQEDLDEFKNKNIPFLKKLYSKQTSKNIVITSEYIESLSNDIKSVENLKLLFKEFGFKEFKIIYYIREQGDFMNSMFSQLSKSGCSFNEDDLHKNLYNCDYKKTIQPFEEVFGRENMDVRIFEKDELKGGSIIEDFLEAIDFDSDISDYIIPKSKNESLSYSGIQILNEINKKESNKKIKRAVTNTISKYFTTPKYQMPVNVYKSIQIKYKDSNEWVRKNYFPNRKTLFKGKEYNPLPQIKIEKKLVEDIASSFIEMTKFSVSNITKAIDNLDTNKIYIIYGYNTVFTKTILKIFNPTNNLILMDKNLANTQDINHPDRLKDLEFDKIIITLIGREEEIISELSQKYNLPKNIFLTLDDMLY